MHCGKIIAFINVLFLVYFAPVSIAINNDILCGPFSLAGGFIVVGLLFFTGLMLAGAWLYSFWAHANAFIVALFTFGGITMLQTTCQAESLATDLFLIGLAVYAAFNLICSLLFLCMKPEVYDPVLPAINV
jgi:hypothetical protein